MGDREVIECIRKYLRITTKRIVELTGLSKNSVTYSLRQMFKHGEILKNIVKIKYHYQTEYYIKE